MENVLLDRSSGSFEFPKRNVYGGCRPGLGARPARPRGAHGSFHTCSPRYHHVQKGSAWNSTPVLPYARPPPTIYSSPSLPLLPSNQPPLLPLPPTATKYATFPFPPPAPPRNSRPAAMTTVPAAAAAPSRQRDRRRRPVRSPPPNTQPAPSTQKKKPLERATPLPPAQVVSEALDDLEQEVARSFVQDLLHALAPPPSSLPLPRFSLVMKASPSAVTASKVAPTTPSCNAEAATADDLRSLLRL